MSSIRTKLGELDIASGEVEETLYTCPIDTEATAKVIVCNRNATAITVRVAHRTTSGTTEDKNYLEYGTSIPAASDGSVTFPWTAMMQAGHSLRVWASATEVNFAAEGLEHVAATV